MIKLRVKWPNPGHVLLASPDITVSADNAQLTPDSQAPGAWDFSIPDGAAVVTLHAVFTADLPVSGNGPATRTFQLFEATQTYAVDGEALTPLAAILENLDDGVGVRVQHPLIQSVAAASSMSGAAVVQLCTEFLDLTHQWKANAPYYWATWLYAQDAEPESDMVALASTGSDPPLWFVHFPRNLDPPSSELGAMVFFRPDANYQYKTAFEKSHRARGFADLSRYLLAPKDTKPVTMGGTNYDLGERYPIADPAYALRVGMQQALLRSGKPIAVFHPWPPAGTQFGDALTPKLPQRLEEMMRFLLGTARLGASYDALTLGRLGLAGYSAGGVPTAKALKANRTRVKEMYLFDPYKFDDEKAFVVDWALRTPDFRLRMTGANFFYQMAQIKMAVLAGLGGGDQEAVLSLRPDSPSFYALARKDGGGDYPQYVFHKHLDYLYDYHVTHQFAIFGGTDIVVDPADPDSMLSNITWMEDFLTNSGF